MMHDDMTVVPIIKTTSVKRVPRNILSMKQNDNFIKNDKKHVIGDGMNARERRHARRRTEREANEKMTEVEVKKEKWATNVVDEKNIKQCLQKSDVIMKERNKLYYLDWDDDDAWDQSH